MKISIISCVFLLELAIPAQTGARIALKKDYAWVSNQKVCSLLLARHKLYAKKQDFKNE
jgi:hypothetical protein